MGMFDTIIALPYPLPDVEYQNRSFQTRDFKNRTDTLFIHRDGRVICIPCFQEADPFVITDLPPRFSMYEWDLDKTGSILWIEYHVYTDGERVVSIQRSEKHWKEQSS